jgi:hypothetical protein
MKKYRIKEWEDAPAVVSHTWIVQKRRFLIFWENVNVFRTYQEAEEWINRIHNRV